MTATRRALDPGLTGLDTGAHSLKLVFSDERSRIGRVEVLDATGRVSGCTAMDEVMAAIPCFTPGCRLLTDSGPRQVTDIAAGDRVMTRDNGLQPVLWVGQRRFDWRALGLNPLLRPVTVRAGALGDGLPDADLTLSPNHRILFATRDADGDRDEGFVPVRDLGARPGVDVSAPASVTYVQVLFDRHEAVLSNGLWSESFQPQDRSIAALGPTAAAEVWEILGDATGMVSGYPPARSPALPGSATAVAG